MANGLGLAIDDTHLPTLERLEPTPQSYAISSDEYKSLPEEWHSDIPARNQDGTGVYCIENIKNKKKYIGSTGRSLRKRMMSHIRNLRLGIHKNWHLQASWDKNGESAFKFSVVARCPPEYRLKLEQKLIDSLGVCDKSVGFNLRREVVPVGGWKHTEKSRKKISAVQARLNQDEEYCKTRTERLRKMHADPAFREKFIEAKRKEFIELWKSDSFRKKHRKIASETMKRLQSDPVFHANNVEKIKKQNSDPVFCEKRNAALEKRNNSPENADRMRERNKDPEFKKMISDQRKAMNADPAFKAKIAALWADPVKRQEMNKKREETRKKNKAKKMEAKNA